MHKQSQLGKHQWLIFVGLSAFLVLRVLWRVFIPAGEWPQAPLHFMSMGFDLLMVAALIGLRLNIVATLPARHTHRSTADVLFWPALVAGLVLLFIRFTSNLAWKTGHPY